jgi:transglutaminase-like putative cysteine protease
MIYSIRHITEYQYRSPVSLCFNQAHLLPRNTPHQTCKISNISITPQPDYLCERVDYFGNRYFYFSVESEHQTLMIDVSSEIETHATNNHSLDFGNSCSQARKLLADARTRECISAKEFLLNSPMIHCNESLHAFATDLFAADKTFLTAVKKLCERIHSEFCYQPQATCIATPLHEVLQNRAGVCQDFAHLAIGCLRSLGFPARYVSGYLETLPPPGQQKLVGADASHAWFAVYSPGEGWFEFDPTNNNMPAEQHITTAWGRDYSDVTPVKGVIFSDSTSQELSVSVDVKRLHFD